VANFDSVYTFIARDKFSGVATKLTNKLDGFNRFIKKINSNLLSFRKRLDKSARSAFSLKKEIKQLIVGFIGFSTVRNVADKALNFEDALLNLSAITGATGKDLDFLKDSSFELGKAFGKSGAETLKAFKLVASAKPELLTNLPALKAVTKEVLTLAAASGLDLAPAAKITAQALNIFNVGADQASRFVNVLGAGAKLGASEIEQTGAALLKAGPAAFAAGLTFESLNSAIQILAKGGIKAEMAGTGLNAMFIKMQAAGHDFKNLSMGEVFENLANKVDRFNTAESRTKFLTALVGLENIKTVEGLILRRKQLDPLTASITNTDIATEQARITLASFRTTLARVGTTIESMIVNNKGPFVNAIKAMTKVVNSFLESFTEDELLGINALLTVLAGVLGLIAGIFGILIKLIAKFLSGLVKVGKFIGLVAANFVLGDAIDFEKELKAINFDVPLDLESLVSFMDPGFTPAGVGRGIVEVLGGVKNETVVTIVDPGKQVAKVENTTTPLAPVHRGFNQGTNMVPAT